MQTAQIVFSQVAILFILIGLGIVLTKTKICTKQLASGMSNLLVMIILPTMILHSFNRPFHAKDLQGFGIALAFAAVFHAIAIAGAYALIRKGSFEKVTAGRLAAVYSNCGFMAFPILSAVFGDVGLFYGSAFVVVFNIMLWTNGIKFLQPDQKLSVKKAILNPGVISVLIGLAIYFLQIPLPGVISQSIEMISNVNTPLSMIVTGIFLSELSLKELFTDGSVVKVTILRNLVFPGILLFLLWVVRIGDLSAVGKEAAVTVIISASCSSAASTPLMIARLGRDGAYGAKLVAFSTLLSIVTLPLLTYLTQTLV